MPILRAGPWGNLTDSFQPVPGATNTLLNHYPVNCAKANWPNQAWTAYYELTEAGCCNPAQIEATFPYTTDLGHTFNYHTVTIDRGTTVFRITDDECGYGYADNLGSYHDRGKLFELVWVPSVGFANKWVVYFGYEDFFHFYYGYLLDSTDECDPTGTVTISGTGSYYDGKTITITDPNA